MSNYFGLYFGNTNLCLAVCKDGATDVIANAAGDRVTPSCVAFTNAEKVVGLPAKQGMIRNASNTMTFIKSMLGDDVEAVKQCKCKIVNEGILKYEIEIDGKTTCYEPSDALVDLFTIMAAIAKNHCHENDIPAVITVPLNFSLKQIETVTSSANKAGFRLLRIITEPAAAALAYDIGQDNSESPFNILVYRMGGTSINVTIIKVLNGMYYVLTSVEVRDFNGNLFTQQILQFCADEFKRQYKADIRENRRSVIKVHSASEVCKHALSNVGTAQCFAESVYDGIDMSINVSRARFESLLVNNLPGCLAPVQEALDNTGLAANDITKLVLAGGSCKIPKLQQALKDLFPGTTVLSSILPDEVIAIGAAKQAWYVPEEDFSYKEEDCVINTLTYAICAKIYKPDSTIISLFPKGSSIPASFSQSLSYETTVTHIDILEQTAEKLLARMPIGSIKNFTILAHLSKEGILHVTCSDNLSEMKRTVTIMPNTE